MASLRLLFNPSLVYPGCWFVIMTALVVRSDLHGRRNKFPGSPWSGPLLVAFGILFAMLQRLYFGMIEVIPATKAAPVLVIATLFVFAGLTLMFRDWRRARAHRSRQKASGAEV